MGLWVSTSLKTMPKLNRQQFKSLGLQHIAKFGQKLVGEGQLSKAHLGGEFPSGCRTDKHLS